MKDLEKLKKERKELEKKRNKLLEFLGLDEAYDNLSDEEFTLLMAQEKIMKEYSLILHHRILIG